MSTADAAFDLIPLGGVGQFGRNCLAIRDTASQKVLIVDAGVRFLGASGHGYDVGLPDLDKLADLAPDVLGYVITHAHEDHIGALPYVHDVAPAPIYASAFSHQLIGRRFKRTGRPRPKRAEMPVGHRRTIGPFTVEFVAVSHSIPQAAAAVVDGPAGRIVHSGDFRVDHAPLLGPPTDMARFAALGDQGVLCLLADSTGAAQEGHNPGEAAVCEPLAAAMQDCPGRLVVTSFASHVQRLKAIVDVARAQGRKVAVLGRGLVDVLGYARQEGVYDPSRDLLKPGQLAALPADEQCWIVTGTQGERRSALARLARMDSPDVVLEPGDRVVFSARVIPGNTLPVETVVNQLLDRGIDVVSGRDSGHVSGHGSRGDLAALLGACRPTTFGALHGNMRHLAAHRSLAAEHGLEDHALLDLRDGATVRLHADGRHAVLDHGDPAAEPWVQADRVDRAPADTVDTRRRMGECGTLVLRLDAGEVVPTAVGTGVLLSEGDVARLGRLLTHTLGEIDPDDDVDDLLTRAVKRYMRDRRAPAPHVVLV